MSRVNTPSVTISIRVRRETLDPKRTRKSLVTHYWRANDMARHKLEGINGGYYFAKDHQPVPSDPAWKRLADRALLEARWAGRLVKRAVGGA